MQTTIEFGGFTYVTSGWIETLLRCLLWLACLDPDPWPRSVDVEVGNVHRFPNEPACWEEHKFWDNRADEIKRLLRSNTIHAGPWLPEVERDLEHAEWVRDTWGYLKEAWYWRLYSHDSSKTEANVILHLERYKDRVGTERYVSGWYPQKVTGK